MRGQRESTLSRTREARRESIALSDLPAADFAICSVSTGRKILDLRLLVAINDVVNGGDLDSDLSLAIRQAAAAGPAVQQSIVDRAATKNASTGRSIQSLHGIANDRATVAAVDGGAKWAGGGGIEGGERVLSEKAVQAQVAAYGITAVATVAEIAVRYALLVRRDRKAAREAAAAADDDDDRL